MPRTDDTRTTRTNRPTNTRTIPGRTPPTEEAGAPIVPTAPPTATPTSPNNGSSDQRRRRRPPAAGERDAPLVPDLRTTEMTTATETTPSTTTTEQPRDDRPN
ncbi:MAG: hypothetical protein ABEH81_14505 [Halopenitus sp.]